MENNFEEPNFDMEQDLFVMVKDEKRFNDDEVNPSLLKANILILSYNRPRMLQEAIESILGQEYYNFELMVIDDGSDFDVWGTIDSFRDKRLTLVQAPQITIEERLQKSRIAENMNQVISNIPDEQMIFYLCDDDIFAPRWLIRAMLGATSYPDMHIVQGEAWYFNDGEDWRTEAIYGMPDGYQQQAGIPTMYWSTGSFAHRALCWKQEGLRWKDNSFGHSQDTNFILNMWNTHKNYLVVNKPAIYRREHENALSSKLGRKDKNGRYKPGFLPPKVNEKMITGMME